MSAFAYNKDGQMQAMKDRPTTSKAHTPTDVDGLDCVGWAAMEAGPHQKLVKHSFTRGPLKDTDCDIDVICCGICHSDIHLNNGDWGPFSVFPQVAGHEFVGKVTNVGKSASVSIGDIVAVGWQGASCQDCEWCGKLDENLCAGNTPVAAAGNKGGFADKWRGDSRFTYIVPDGLEPKFVGPLLCGGITMWSPLVKHSSEGERVGILGIGGLGHMGIKFAKALGRKVTAFSRSDAKKEATLAMGADVYVNSSDEEQVKAQANTVDCLIVTINSSVDWTPYVTMLRPNGKLLFVGAITDAPISVPIFGPLIMKQISFVGSCIGGSQSTREMLQFVADHPEAAPIVEVMPFSQINEAVQKVVDATARFRMVVEN